MRVDLPYLDLGNVYLRDVCMEDYLDFFDYTKDEETTRYLTYGPLNHPQEALYLIQEFNLKRPSRGLPVGYAIVWKKNHKMIGTIDFHTYYSAINACEIGFMLHPLYQGRGIMTKCLKTVMQVGFSHLGLDKIIAGHVDENLASKNLILRCGFTYEREAYAAFELPNNEKRSILYYSIYKEEFERKMNV